MKTMISERDPRFSKTLTTSVVPECPINVLKYDKGRYGVVLVRKIIFDEKAEPTSRVIHISLKTQVFDYDKAPKRKI